MAVLRAAGSAATRLAGHPWHADLDSALRKLRWYGAEAVPAPSLHFCTQRTLFCPEGSIVDDEPSWKETAHT